MQGTNQPFAPAALLPSHVIPSYSQLRFTDILTRTFQSRLPLTLPQFLDHATRYLETVQEALRTFWITACAKAVDACLPTIIEEPLDGTTKKKQKERQAAATTTKTTSTFIVTSKATRRRKHQLHPHHPHRQQQSHSHHRTTEADLTLKRENDDEKEDTDDCMDDEGGGDDVKHLLQYNHHMGVLNAASVLMSRQLRETVDASILAIQAFFERFSTDAVEAEAVFLLRVECVPEENRYFQLEPSPATLMEKISAYLSSIVEGT
jgi:hypothetical protein